MNMGMNTGAMIAHLALALPITRLIAAATNTKQSMSATGPRFAAFSTSAPLMAMIRPRLVQLK